MKTLINKTRIAAIALVAVFTVAFGATAMANGTEKEKKEKNAIPVEFKYIGKVNDQPVFVLSFNNTEESDYTVVIRDEEGNVLYKDNVKGGSKKFLLNENLGAGSIQFEISGKKTDKTVVFQVDRNSRVVEDLVVNKLK